jgi:pimeloyl-ACP methyl ester carboxylesterase
LPNAHSSRTKAGMRLHQPTRQPTTKNTSFASLKQIDAGLLNVGYAEAGPANGPAVILLQGWPYDIYSYVDVAPLLASAGYRVIVPYLRGFGTTRFLSSETFRNGQQSVVALDIIALMDALKIDKAILAGFDWGGRTADIIAVLWPERCKALVSVSGYLIPSQAANRAPLPPKAELQWWYQFYFATERGRDGYDKYRHDFAKLIWQIASPKWNFDDATFDRSAASFDNPDHVAIVIHSYRWRLGLVEGEPKYDDLEKRLAAGPVITVPTITLEGDANGAPHYPDPSAFAKKFSGKYAHRTITGGVGHNLPQEAPEAFAKAVIEVDGYQIYIEVGSYLVPNNLSANAHGNGYSDPNIFIPEVLESVQIDGGAFNVREGNHSVNLAATYGLRSRLDPFITLTGDYRDLDVVAGLSPSLESWMAFEGSYGNGFLDRLEHRQQYKFNGERLIPVGRHWISLFGIGYYGFSYVPGLVPIFAENQYDNKFPNYRDTIDLRQKDQTHTALVAVNDNWQLNGSQQLQVSGFLRTYNLSLFSDFGQGLIRQSEFRTVVGASANYVNKVAEYLSLLAGFDYEREAPRRDDLDHYGFFNPGAPDYYGPFTPVDGNNVTITPYTPYVAAEGALARYFRYYLGWRRDEIDIDNDDLLHSQNSFQNGWG